MTQMTPTEGMISRKSTPLT